MSKLVLGTAQFGLDYGISNKNGQVGIDTVKEILSFSQLVDISLIDTAVLYGDSEKIIGGLIKDQSWRVITKTPYFHSELISESDVICLEKTFKKSLLNLTLPQVEGLLIHSCNDLFKPGGDLLIKKLQMLRSEGLVKKIGATVYSGEQIEQLMEKFDFDLIQLPVNILDQRLIHSGHLKMLKDKGVEIHARSAFLQGLLLMEIGGIHDWFAPIISKLSAFCKDSEELSMSRLELALAFVQSVDEIDNVVVGVTSKLQLEEVVKASHNFVNTRDYHHLAVNDERYINPALWNI